MITTMFKVYEKSFISGIGQPNTYVLTQRTSLLLYCTCCMFWFTRKNQLKRFISIRNLATLICFKSVKRTSSYLFMNWTSLVALNVCSSMQTVWTAQYKDDSCHYLAVYLYCFTFWRSYSVGTLLNARCSYSKSAERVVLYKWVR